MTCSFSFPLFLIGKDGLHQIQKFCFFLAHFTLLLRGVLDQVINALSVSFLKLRSYSFQFFLWHGTGINGFLHHEEHILDFFWIHVSFLTRHTTRHSWHTTWHTTFHTFHTLHHFGHVFHSFRHFSILHHLHQLLHHLILSNSLCLLIGNVQNDLQRIHPFLTTTTPLHIHPCGRRKNTIHLLQFSLTQRTSIRHRLNRNTLGKRVEQGCGMVHKVHHDGQGIHCHLFFLSLEGGRGKVNNVNDHAVDDTCKCFGGRFIRETRLLLGFGQ
mmetsp:Transcript_26657/g.48396  ORF Transcript_26657/g.48396 Transcript_26657/m.48396 type:complete len:270 (-) Transcript_26657:409-1218(-)